MFGFLSDLHKGLGDKGDISNDPGIRRVILAMLLLPQLRAILLGGDAFDGTRFGLLNVLRANREFLVWLAQEVLGRGVQLVWILGNHEKLTLSDDKLLGIVREILAAAGLEEGKGLSIVQGEYAITDADQVWHCTHGHQWDKLNSDTSWFKPIARGATWVSGQIGRVWPAWDDKYVNPVSWISAAKRGQEAVELIKSAACKHADDNDEHVLFGHTHQLVDVESDVHGFHVFNAGCCCKGKAVGVVAEGGEARVVLAEGFDVPAVLRY